MTEMLCQKTDCCIRKEEKMKTTLDNPVLDVLNTLCNFVALNLLFLITCLPVITIGAALSSLYCVTMKEARGEYGYLVRTYIKEFKRNLKSGTAVFAVLFLLGAILLFNLAFWFAIDTTFAAIIGGLLIAASAAWFLTASYAFPLTARFENNTIRTLKNAFRIALSSKKATLFLLLTDAVFFFFCMFLPPVKILMVLFGFAFLAYCQSHILIKVFEPFEMAQEGDTTL